MYTQQAISELISRNFPGGLESSVINENAFLMKLKEERRKCFGIKEKSYFYICNPNSVQARYCISVRQRRVTKTTADVGAGCPSSW